MKILLFLFFSSFAWALDIDILQKGAEAGDAQAQAELGRAYLKGEGVVSDFDKGLYWINKSVEQANPVGQRVLGTLFYTGAVNLPKNEEEGLRLLSLAAEADDVLAQVNLGGCFLQKKEWDAAAHWFEKAALQGNAQALCFLGSLYIDGFSRLGKDEKKAVQLFKEADERGFPKASFDLGRCYRDGKGVEVSTALMKKYFERSSALGFPLAHLEMADFYTKEAMKTKHPSPESLKMGALYARKAIEAGAKEGYNYEAVFILLNQIPLSMEMMELYTKEANKGNVRAQKFIADVLENGKYDVTPHAAQSRIFLEKAAAQGDKEAIKRLKAAEQADVNSTSIQK